MLIEKANPAIGFDSRCNWISEEKSQTITHLGGGGSYAYLIMTYEKQDKEGNDLTHELSKKNRLTNG